MQQRFFILLSLVAPFVLFSILIACTKELSCESCREANKSPLAHAGPDQTITLPTDSVSLDGSASSDPDGKISTWLWTKISGPASYAIVHTAVAKTLVRNLKKGMYQFELKVTDDGGLSARDTIQVLVNDPAQLNRPPVACAGADQTISLPTNSVTLNGSCSTDPDNNITAYLWTKIAGPLSFSITNANAVQTQVSNLTEGMYQFELKVTDAGGLFSKDTVQITVKPGETGCDSSNRAQINVRLIPIGTLSKPREGMAVAAAGNKIVFAGGAWTPNCPECWGSPQVDIYDVATNTWSTAKLSEGRWSIGAVAAGNKLFFAGGQFGDGALDTYFNNVDIYDASTNTWTAIHLSQARGYIAAGATGNKVLFAGGEYNWNYDVSSVVDIYDMSTGSLYSTSLAAPRAHISAVTANNKIYLAGGSTDNRWYYSPSALIDIFDNATNTWTTASLSEPMNFASGISVGDNIYWGSNCTVEIKDRSSWASSFAHPYIGIGFDVQAVKKDNYVLFIGGWRGSFPTNGGYTNKMDIYDTATKTWSVGVASVKIQTAVSYNNIVYVTDGVQVYQLEF